MLGNYFVYILANRYNTVLYIGVTNSIERRLYEHQNEPQGFVNKYNCSKLIYIERFSNAEMAIAREKQLKRWNRLKKENLIKKLNPEFLDISDSVIN